MSRVLWILFGVLFLAGLLWLQAGPTFKAEAQGPVTEIQQILKNQEKILQDLEEIKQQLSVIRIRVS